MRSASMLLLDPVLHLTSGTIELVIKPLWTPLETGNDETEILSFVAILALGNDSPLLSSALPSS